jgi:hypothetical protein
LPSAERSRQASSIVLSSTTLTATVPCLVVAGLPAQATRREWPITGATLAVAIRLYLLRARRAAR